MAWAKKDGSGAEIKSIENSLRTVNERITRCSY